MISSNLAPDQGAEDEMARFMMGVQDDDESSYSHSPVSFLSHGNRGAKSESCEQWEEASDSGSSSGVEDGGGLVLYDSPFSEASSGSHSEGGDSPVQVAEESSWSEVSASDGDSAELEDAVNTVDFINKTFSPSAVPPFSVLGLRTSSEKNSRSSSRSVSPEVAPAATEAANSFGAKVKWGKKKASAASLGESPGSAGPKPGTSSPARLVPAAVDSPADGGDGWSAAEEGEENEDLVEDGSPGEKHESEASKADQVMRKLMMALDEIDSAKEHSERIEISKDLRVKMENLLSLLKKNERTWLKGDSALFAEAERINSVWQTILGIQTNGQNSKPVFLFKDGVVTSAVKRGQLLLIEDFDLPNQAVVERLNSLLEPTPTFSITEDITMQRAEENSLLGDRTRPSQNIPILPSFQVIATVHSDSPSAKLNLSPATRSRFTEIHVQTYSRQDLVDIVMAMFTAKLPEPVHQIQTAVELLFIIRDEVNLAQSHGYGEQDPDIHKLFRLVYFVLNHDPRMDLVRRVWLASRFFYFDSSTNSRGHYQEELQKQCIDSIKEKAQKSAHLRPLIETCSESVLKDINHIFRHPMSEHGAFVLEDDASAFRDSLLESIIEKVFSQDRPVEMTYRLKYTGVIFKTHEPLCLQNELGCAPIPSFVNQDADRGIKRLVSQVARMVTGQDVARINFSANTTLDHLLGAVVPRCVNGKRTFEWQDGKVVQALRAGQWLLLDEINLASPDVLDGLARLFPMPGESARKSLRLPSGLEIDIPPGFHVFATMNPASIGGGRFRLPRSIGNLFASVHLEESSQEELRVILEYMFINELESKSLSPPQLQALFELHWTIKGMIEKSDVGRVGGPYEINLRDLAKVRDVLAGNSSDQKYHYMVSNGSETNSSVEDVNVLSLRRFAELVYAGPFHSFEDQAIVSAQINKYFPLAGLDGTAASHCDVTVVEGSVRIGSIYMTQGTALSNGATLELTKRTVAQLEMLAAAAQSKRAVLLEGDTCSRKTALVQELARITRHELLVIPMNEDTETSDLIGQWLPMTAEDGSPSFRANIRYLVSDVMRSVVLHCSDLLDRKAIKNALGEVSLSFARFNSDSAADAESLRRDAEMLSNLKVSLEAIRLEARVSHAFGYALLGHVRKICDVVERIEEVLKREDDDSGISFSFVKSDFVKAIENGGWVLLDGVNSAPSEVVERLNSLLEERPMLNLYEHAEGKVLTWEDGIHPDFRLFTTANIYRKNSNKLSTAFLNRMVRIWLPQIDSELLQAQSVSDTDLMELIKMQLGGVSGGLELSTVLLRFHKLLQDSKNTQGKIVFVTGFSLSFRCLQQTLRTMLHLVGENESPVQSLVWAIERNYTSAAASAAGKKHMRAILSAELRRDDILNDMGGYSSLPPPLDAMMSKHLIEGREMNSLMCILEERLSQLANTVLVHLVENGANMMEDRAIKFVVSVFDSIYLHKFPNDALIMTKLDELKEKDNAGMQQAKDWVVRDLPAVLKSSKHDLEPIKLEAKNQCLRRLSDVVKKIRDAAFLYVEHASFKDIQHRAAALSRVRAVLLQYMCVFKFEGRLSKDDTKDTLFCGLLLGGLTAVANLSSLISTMLKWTEAMKQRETKLEPLRKCLDQCLEDDRAAMHALQMQQTRRIIGPPPSWPSLSAVVQSIVTISDRATYVELMPYCSMMQWEGLQFEFKLNPTCRLLEIEPPQIEFLSTDNMEKLEELWCVANVKTDCPKLLDHFDSFLSSFQLSWGEVQSEMNVRSDELRKLQSEQKEQEELVDKQQARIEERMSVLHDKQREVFPNETQEECQKRKEELKMRAFDINEEAVRVQQLRERVDDLELVNNNKNLEMCQSFLSRQEQVLQQLQRDVDGAIKDLIELKSHECYRFLAKMHVTPGVSAASDFLNQVLAQIEQITSSRQQVCPASLEIGFGQLLQSQPRLLASEIGKLLIGTFLVTNPRDRTGMLLRQRMVIVNTHSEVMFDPELLGQSLFYIFFVCGVNSEDDLSLCVCNMCPSLTSGGDANMLEVHHWHSHNEGSKGHVQWVHRLVSSVQSLGLKVKESSPSLSSEGSLATNCFLALQSLDVGLSETSPFAVKELSNEESEDLRKSLKAAVKRMGDGILGSVHDSDSDLTAIVDLVHSDLNKISHKVLQDTSMTMKWDEAKRLVEEAQDCISRVTSSKNSAVFSETSRDESSKELKERLGKLNVESSIDPYRVVRRLRELDKTERFTVITEIERRLRTGNESLDTASKEFERCDKAVQLVRKVIFVFVDLLYAHVRRGSFAADSAHNMIEMSQSALTLCRELSAHALGCIECSVDTLMVCKPADKEFLSALATRAEQLLQDFEVMPSTVLKIDMAGTIHRIFDELQLWHCGDPVPSSPAPATKEKVKESSAKCKARENIDKMESLIQELRQMKPQPHKVLHRIRTFINELERAIECEESESNIDKLLVKRYNPIKREVEDVRIQAKARESAWLRDFQIEGLDVIPIDHTTVTHQDSGQDRRLRANQAYKRLTEMSTKDGADALLDSAKMYVSISAKMRCWQHLLQTCSLLHLLCHCQEVCLDEFQDELHGHMEKLFLLSMIVSDDIAKKLNADQTRMNTEDTVSVLSVVKGIFPMIVQFYQEFRADLLQKRCENTAEEWALEELQSKLFDFALVKDLCSPIALTQDMSFGKLLPSMKSMLMRSAAVQDEILCYPKELSFHLEPLVLRISDCLALLFPDDLHSIHHLSSAQDIFDQDLASRTQEGDQRTWFRQSKSARAEDGGISSELERRDKSGWLGQTFQVEGGVHLYEEACVQQVFRESREMSFDLFDKLHGYFSDPSTDSRSVLHVFDSSDQVPPWQIAVSLSLFSTTNSILSILYHDESQQHRNRIFPNIQLDLCNVFL